ncbi:MAG: hypothetical protein Q4C45_03570 [Oscillospiraceae bacterium]|nr:hypothetical protein [Oscillospiraceae bacterium]
MYEQYLLALLAPLGVYDLKDGSVSGAELHALGAGLDAAALDLDAAERESLTATAEGEGLARREALFARRPAAAGPEERRAAIAALLQIDGDSLTPEAINRTIRGCGIKARALEMGEGKLRVIFPEVVGVPAEFEQVRRIILDILPCHLAVEFYFRYLTWAECEWAGYTWAEVEAAEHTWESFQLAVPPED